MSQKINYFSYCPVYGYDYIFISILSVPGALFIAQFLFNWIRFDFVLFFNYPFSLLVYFSSLDLQKLSPVVESCGNILLSNHSFPNAEIVYVDYTISYMVFYHGYFTVNCSCRNIRNCYGLGLWRGVSALFLIVLYPTVFYFATVTSIIPIILSCFYGCFCGVLLFYTSVFLSRFFKDLFGYTD